MFTTLIDLLARVMVFGWNKIHRRACAAVLKTYPNISPGVSIGVGSIIVGPKSNFFIGRYTYINCGSLSCGINSKIVIGEGCAIGYNVSIKAITHAKCKPTTNRIGPSAHVERDIIIGDDCWIGDNVFIREGVTIGDRVIVGANSVVIKSIDSGSIVAGAPARVIGSVV